MAIKDLWLHFWGYICIVSERHISTLLTASLDKTNYMLLLEIPHILSLLYIIKIILIFVGWFYSKCSEWGKDITNFILLLKQENTSCHKGNLDTSRLFQHYLSTEQSGRIHIAVLLILLNGYYHCNELCNELKTHAGLSNSQRQSRGN